MVIFYYSRRCYDFFEYKIVNFFCKHSAYLCKMHRVLNCYEILVTFIQKSLYCQTTAKILIFFRMFRGY